MRLASSSIVLGAFGALCGCAGTPRYTSAAEGQLRTAERIPWEIVTVLPHSTDSFTEGLVFAGGRLFESVGQYGKIKLIELNPQTGATLASHETAELKDFFAEGIAFDGKELVQLSWKSQFAVRWDLATMKTAGRFTYKGDVRDKVSEGWGLCFDGTRFYRSDGLGSLWIHGTTFAGLGKVAVTIDGRSVEGVNELECVGTNVYGNVWHTPLVARIDSATGRVTGILDFGELVKAAKAKGTEGVLNGIAFDARTGHWFVTGKLWPKLYVVKFAG